MSSNNIIRNFLYPALICVLFSNQGIAGEVINIINKEIGAPNAKEETMQFLFSDGYMKMTDLNESDMIFNSSAKNMTVITHSDKAYMIFDQSTASNVQSEIDKAMEEALASVPPAQRPMIEKMMKQKMSAMGGGQSQQATIPEIEIKKTGRTDTINGYNCEYYEAFKDDQKEAEYCVASWSDLDISDDTQQSFVNMADFMKGFLEELSKMAPVQMGDNPFSNMEKMNGFPILNREFSNGKAIRESILSSISIKDIDKSEFDVPESYQKRNLMGR